MFTTISPESPRSRPGASVHFGVNLFIEEVLPEDVKLPVLFSDGVGTHKLKLLLSKLVKVVLHFPDVGLLQLGCGLFGGGLFFSGLPQVRLFPLSEKTKPKLVDRQRHCGMTTERTVRVGTCSVEFGGSFEEARQRCFQDHDEVLQLFCHAD